MIFFQLYSAAGEKFWDFDIRNANFLNKICISDIKTPKFFACGAILLPPLSMGGKFSKMSPHRGGDVDPTSPPQTSGKWGDAAPPPDPLRMGGMEHHFPRGF